MEEYINNIWKTDDHKNLVKKILQWCVLYLNEELLDLYIYIYNTMKDFIPREKYKALFNELKATFFESFKTYVQTNNLNIQF